jgi:hypothetical protein
MAIWGKEAGGRAAAANLVYVGCVGDPKPTRLRESCNSASTCNLVTETELQFLFIGVINSDRIYIMLLVTMHLCYEVLSLILFPLLPPLAIVIIVIIVMS